MADITQHRTGSHIAGAVAGAAGPVVMAVAIMLSGASGIDIDAVSRITLSIGLSVSMLAVWFQPQISWPAFLTGLAMGCAIALAALGANPHLAITPIPNTWAPAL